MLEPLSLQTLSALLWVAFGINRRDGGGRTAPSAHNAQEISNFATLPEGAYRYDASSHRQRLVRAEDLRATTGQQDDIAAAPLRASQSAPGPTFTGTGTRIDLPLVPSPPRHTSGRG